MVLNGIGGDSRPLNVVIVGAGIGGLTAGLALRQIGHNVTILETSKFSNETGAAIHIAPNCSGLLQRMGLYIEKVGGNAMNGVAMFLPNGKKIMHADMRESNKQWQHPWHLVHRAHLHTAIREAAVSSEGKGKPCDLKLSSKVVSVDTENAKVTTESGEVFSGDVVLGADGVHSVCRSFVVDAEKYKPYDSGHSAFRFLVPVKELRDDPVTAELLQPDGYLTMNLSEDRRLVYYPCVNNTLMNFLLIHPSGESRSDGVEWNQKGDKNQMLEIGKIFPDNFKALMSKAPEDSLKVWTLLDLEVIPTWVNGRLALLGDAAHPFQPHQAQGGAQAIEDAVSLAAVLPLGTSPDEINDRLELYVKQRKHRADRVQEFTRISGMSPPEQKKRGIVFNPATFNDYNFSHDEWDSSNHALKKHLLAKYPYRYRQPLSFGPSPGPRQPQNFLRGIRSHAMEWQQVHTIRFTTSGTFLKTLFPTDQFEFTSPATVQQASFTCCSLRDMVWLGGTGYNHCGLYIHGVKYTAKDGTVKSGTFLPMLFESLTDPIVTGREELGAPKWGCDIDISPEDPDASGTTKIEMGWRGRKFGNLVWEGLEEREEEVVPKPQPDDGMLMYKYVPAVGQPGKADAEYAVFDPFMQPGTSKDGQTNGAQANGHDETKPKAKTLRARNARIEWDARDWETLPTVHHIIDGFKQVPIYKILEATVSTVPNVYDVSGAFRIE
ncbi:Ubiquinone biosynthesis monooxygenase COQ6, mitochondrial [Elsinoe australis]|uniref:Ubiquinone biosynthesis monooxygenase COQ6, mitochondrial n=1 Tax=Elsinoe australis TaxID=40998 RepID=A0A2P7ZK59_9PEZI|nr:Ubiquinone biosynthesis monooxygenase COQ6, mitochondrial [Elsinoe australis]